MDPFADVHYKAGISAQESGDLPRARSQLEIAAKSGNVVALLQLCEVCAALGDRGAVVKHLGELESRAFESAESSYVVAKAFEHGACRELVGDSIANEKRKTYLVRAAECGNHIAQLEVAENFASGLNNFERDATKSALWLQRAKGNT